MILVGRNSSPFVRRVAISLRLLGLPFEQKLLSTIANREEVLALNPLGRIPALVLEGGETLIDSSAILDHLDELAGPDKALVPPSGADRRRVLKLVALGTGAMEKLLSCYVERNIRPLDKQHQDLLERFAAQAMAGLQALEEQCGDGWLFGGKITQADVTTVAALGFVEPAMPGLLPPGRLPKLQALRARAETLPAFADSKV